MNLHDLFVMVRDTELVISNLEAREALMNAEGDSYFLDTLVEHIDRDVALTTMLIDTRITVGDEEMSLYEGMCKIKLISIFLDEAVAKGFTDKIPGIISYHAQLEAEVTSILLNTDVPSMPEDDDENIPEGGDEQ